MQKLLIIGRTFPEPNTTATGKRMMQLIAFFQQNNYAITFSSTAQPTKYSIDLKEIGISVQQIELNNASFDEFIKTLQPNIVLFDRFISEEHFGWRVAEKVPNAIRILDTEDLHFLREAREISLKKKQPINLFSALSQREIASIYRCDVSLIISEYEMDLLKKEFNIKDNILHYLPFLVNENAIKSTNELPSFKERQHFISVGNFLHAPNLDAVVWLKKDIWEKIKNELPNAELHIYGAYVPQQVQEFHNKKEGFIVKGWAKDIDTVMQHAKACLAPLRFGAGLKGKLLDALLNGTPAITTTEGAEGMYGDFNAPGVVAEKPIKFIEKAIELYSNEEKWTESIAQREEILKNRFGKQQFQELLKNKITQLNNNIESHRNKNFVGRILNNNAHNSLKYMSKWIEEKNKLANRQQTN
ncbi:MAG: glycosyltransferase [Chitinophagales bacterium]|nr:glycosyltransferase [Chitinophagales bacterium]